MKYEYEEEEKDGKSYQSFYQAKLPQLTTDVNIIAEVVVIKARGFEEMPQVIQLLWKRKSVLLNLMMMDIHEAQRAVDFVAGGTYAIDGHQERVGDRVFLFTPTCVLVTTGLKCL